MGKHFLFFLCFCMSVGTITAQTATVKGLVQDENGNVLIGASVMETGTSNAVITNIDGKFELSIGSSSTLSVSYVGHVTRTVTVDPRNRNNIVVTLDADNQLLDEVMIVAFGKMKKEAFTGSAGIVSSDDLAKSHASNPAQALAGRVSGVQLSNSSFQPGSSPSITIRGFGSISSDTEPLIVLDGMPFDGDLNIINSADIESMTVLKDAASNALYGARGANGVIMVTTKRGRTGQATINVNANWGVNSNGQSMYKTTNAKQFYETYYKMLYNQYVATDEKGGKMTPADAHREANRHLTDSSTGVGPGYMVYTVPSGQDFIQTGGMMNPGATMGASYTYGGKNLWLQADDWAKEGLQNGFRHEYDVSVSGASDRINYYTSIGFLDMKGIQENSGQKRISARAKLDYQARKWLRIGTNFNYSRYEYGQTGEGTIGAGSLWGVVRTQAPIYPVYFRDANKNIMIDEWGEKMYDFAQSYGLSRAGGIGGNTIFGNKYRQSGSNANAMTVNGYADILLTKDLTATVNASIYSYDSRYTYINSPFVDNYTSSSENGYLYKSASRIFSYNVQQLLNYTKQFGRHEVTALLGHEYYKYKDESLSASGYNFGIDGTTELATVLNLNNSAYSGSGIYNNEGYFFRGMYNYSQKYYASASFRRDASSRFAKQHRWGSFWSAGAAWIVSKEDFFDVSWVNQLKLRLSVGSQGNDNIGNYLYADSYDIVNNDDRVSYQWRQKGSETITWETNTNWNAGLEFDLFKGRLSGSVDYFYRKTSDMLFSLGTPPSIGYTSYFVNLGDMRNSGVEVVLNANILNNRHFRWNVNFNISHVKNKVLKLPDDIKVTNVEGYDGYVNLDKSFVSKYQYFVAEGLPLYTWYLKQYAGVDPATGEALYYKNTVDDEGNVTGRETVNNSSVATDYLCGDALPSFYGGIGTSLEFYGIDFSFNLTYQLGGKVFDYNYQTLMHSSGTTDTTWHTDIFKAWTPDNTDTNVPRLRYTETYGQNARSDRFLTSASYLNIQNVTLGYTLPTSLTNRLSLQKIRLYVSADNLYLFSARRGLDPRQRLQGYTNPETSYPIRTLLGGISLTF